MVLSSLREAMPGRERIQMPRRLRSPFTTNARRGRACRQTHRRLFQPVPARICHTAVSKASAADQRSSHPTLICSKVWYKAGPRKSSVPRIHRGQAPPPHEFHTLGHPDRVCKTLGSDGRRSGGRDREGLVPCLDRQQSKGSCQSCA